MDTNRRGWIIAGRRSLWLVLCITLVAGCATEGGKADIGALIGAVTGGFIGSKVDDGPGGVLVGAALGGYFGHMIGKYMDERDRERLASALEQTPTDQTYTWTNQDSGRHFEVTPTTDTYAQAGKACRNFTQVVIVNGEEQTVDGTACKAPDEPDWNVI